VAVISTVSIEALAGTLPRTPLAVLPTPLVAAPRLVAVGQAMRTEGLMLDPVYTAKALAQAPRRGSVVFWHTGGVLDAVAAAQEAAS